MATSKIRASDIQRKFDEQGGRCAYTGDELTPENLTADHYIPVSRGGSLGVENVRLVTEQVNRAKHTMSMEEFIELCRKVVAWADRSQAS